MNIDQSRAQTLKRILHMAARTRRQEITLGLYQKFAGAVQTGPFQGMWLPQETSWSDGDSSAKLLGCYEEELHGLMREIAGRGYPVVVNIGCAEGYYAVGLARLMQNTRVLAFDTDANAQRVCRQAAEVNGVADRLETGGACDTDLLRRILSRPRDSFLLVDCEGAELHLLHPEAVPALAECDFLVECHDFIDRSITQTLQARFLPTHDLRIVREGPRDPNAYPMLARLGSLDRWLTVCEFRPEVMHWLYARRREGA